jgi:SAM-dependent methyltransferase
MAELDRVVEEIRRWGYSAAGFAERYDRYRPRPPVVLLELLPLLAGVQRPELVVDLGSGTGLSTRFWAEHADTVLGVEPNPEMREVAVAATEAPNVSYQAASAYETGLPDACADIVSCSQSLQWMEPAPTFAEVARLLRPGRLFAAYEYRWSLTTSPAANAAFEATYERKGRLLDELGLVNGKARWPVTRERFVDSGHFVAVEETVLHSVEQVDADRLVGFALSEGSMQTLLAAGVTEEQVGLDLLRAAAATGLGDAASPWYLGYRLVVGWLTG